MFFLATVSLLLTLAAPALADSITISVDNWHSFGGGDGAIYMFGDIVDQDPSVEGAQVWIVSAGNTAYLAGHTYYDERTGTYQECLYVFDHDLGPSPYPQATTLDGTGTLYEGEVAVYILDTYVDHAARAAEVYAAGTWKLYYYGGQSAEVDCYVVDPSSPYCPQVDDPINAASGTAIASAVDLELPGRGLPLVLARNYDSTKTSEPGPLGNGWSFSYGSHLGFPSADLVWVVYPDGTRHRFHTTNGGLTYTAPTGVFETLERLMDGSYALTFKAGTTYAYSSTGLLTSITDRYGNTTTLTYQGGVLTQVADASGRSLAFTYSGGRIILAEAKTSGVTQQSVSFTYDAAGNLATVTDANGHTTGYAYDSSHRLVSERQPRAMADPSLSPLFTNTWILGKASNQADALSRTTSLGYDPAAQETVVENARGYETTYAYDSKYRLTALSDPLDGLTSIAYGANGLPESVCDPNAGVTHYEYDPRGNLTSLHDPEGHVSRAGFDTENNLVWSQDALGERLSRTTSGLLLRDDFSLNSLANYTVAVESSGPSWSIANGLLSQTLRKLRASSLTRNGISDAACATARMTPEFGAEAEADLLVATGAREASGKGFPGYDARISTTAATLNKRASGAWVWLASQSYSTPCGTYRQARLYLDDGVVHMRVGAADLSEVHLSAADTTYSSGSGGLRQYAVFDCDYLELRTSHRVTVTGLPAGYLVKVSRGPDTAQAFSSGGSTVVDAGALLFPLDKIEIYDTSAMRVAELSSLDLADMGGGDVFAYDGNAGHRTTFAWDATGTCLNSMTTPVGTTSFTYNTDGSLDSLTDARNHTWAYAYNTFGDLTSLTDPLNYVTGSERDAVGRLTAYVDANQSRTEYEYDDVGQLVTIKTAPAELDPLNRHQIDITYDANGNQTLITDANGNETEFTYDDMNCLTGVTNALSCEATYGYDPGYNLASVQDLRGYTTSYTYDECDRLAGVTDPLSRSTTFTYDPAGNLTEVAYASGNEIAYTYTPTGLVSHVSYSGDPTTWSFSYDATGALTEAEKSDGKTWAFAYDAGSRLATATDENNSVLGPLTLGYIYDAVSNLTALDVGPLSPFTYTYNARDELASLAGPGGTTSFTHDSGGRLTQVATPDGSTRSYTYDAQSSLSAVTNVTGSGTQSLTYTRDANGNTLSQNGSTYTYDALNRLVSWYEPGVDLTTTYTYDAAGNLTGVEADGLPTESYTYNAANEITNTGVTYDLNGNLTSDGTHTYAYDAEDRLVQVSGALGTLATMTYDFADRRTSRTTASGTTYFHYDGSRLVAESDSTGTITAAYTYAGGGLLSMTRDSSTYFYQTNAHGDVVSLTDSSGVAVNTYTYDPWGAPLTVSETVPNPFRYASYYYDTDTCLYYLHHRCYDPELRRFLTLDPVGGLVARPTSFNLYLYCVDNPLGYVDPSGLFFDVFIDVAFAAYDVYEALAGGWKNIGTNLAALGADLGSAFVPGFSGGGMIVRAGSKIDNAVGAGRAASRAKKWNFARNVAEQEGGKIPGTQAHHGVPQEFGPDVPPGMNIHDPKYGWQWEASDHLGGHYQYNKEWRDWFDTHPNATQEAIEQQLWKMKGDYGF